MIDTTPQQLFDEAVEFLSRSGGDAALLAIIDAWEQNHSDVAGDIVIAPAGRPEVVMTSGLSQHGIEAVEKILAELDWRPLVSSFEVLAVHGYDGAPMIALPYADDADPGSDSWVSLLVYNRPKPAVCPW